MKATDKFAQKIPSKIAWQLEETKTGFSAFAEQFSIYTTADDLESLMPQLNEAAALYFEIPDEETISFRHSIYVDLQTFFVNYKILNARILALRIGMSPSLLSQYIRGKKSPSLRQIERIREGIQQISRELAGVHFVARGDE
jgi:transcriptional regulator with XRE-family HTH domain